MPKAAPKTERRDAARERARAMREAAARKRRQRRIAAVSAGIVAVLVIVAVVAVLISKHSSSSAASSARPPGVNAHGGIVVGAAGAPHTVTIYEDLQCPNCKAFEASADTWLKQQVDAKKITLEFRPVAFLDPSSNGNKYSTRAANAAMCVAGDSSVDFFAWNKAMYDQQPAEDSGGRSDSALIAVAKKQGASAAVGRCIVGQKHVGWVTHFTDTTMTPKGSVGGTPTVLVDGKVVNGGAANTVPSLADVQKALAS